MLSPVQLGLLIFITMGGMAAAFTLDFWLAAGFSPGLALLIYLCKKCGISPGDIRNGAIQGAISVRLVVYILILVSLLIPCWMASGIISYAIDIGVSLINPDYFLTCAFLLTTVVALMLGTSTGSISAVGLPLMGIGSLLGVPPCMTGGAVVSGAFVGDRTSPLASANQLVASFTGINMKQQMETLLPTTVLAIAATTAFYLLMDFTGGWQGLTTVTGCSAGGWLYFGPWLLVPPLLMLGAIGLRCQPITAFLLAIFTGLGLGSMCQGISAGQWVNYLLIGYNDNIGGLILQGKGFLYMLPLILFIMITGAFNGILEQTGLIKPYIEKIFCELKSLTGATLRMGVFGLAMNILCCNQTMPIMITAGSVRPVWVRSFSPKQLSRVVADTSLVLAGLVPWNLFALICSSIIGVPVVQYLCFASFLWITPLATIVWSCFEEYGTCLRGAKEY